QPHFHRCSSSASPDTSTRSTFPTRRSSDLLIPRQLHRSLVRGFVEGSLLISDLDEPSFLRRLLTLDDRQRPVALQVQRLLITHRSEEHTSELQSRFDLVCRLLLDLNAAQLR